MINGMKVDFAVIDELATEKSGYELRQERYRESNANKKARDLDRRNKRKDKRRQAY